MAVLNKVVQLTYRRT